MPRGVADNRTSDQLIQDIQEKRARSRKPRKGQSTKAIDLDILHKRLLNVLNRDVANLLQASSLGPLNRDETNALTGYLKLLGQLKKMDKEDSDTLSDEQLSEIANKPEKG
jgi:hypothetical protein